MDWSQPTTHDWPRDKPLDPYVQWAERSQWRGYVSQSQFKRPQLADSWITFIAELSANAASDPVAAIGALHNFPDPSRTTRRASLIYIPKVYRETVPGAAFGARFFTGRIQHRNLKQLQSVPFISRWELAQPVGRPDLTAVLAPDVGTSRAPDHVPSSVRDCIRPQSQEKADQQRASLLGIIDSGCAFLHPSFRDKHGQSRIVQFWDQGIGRRFGRSYWSPASNFGYGSVLWKDDIDRLLNLHRPRVGGQALDEVSSYEALDHMVRHGRVGFPVRRAMHGTHVLDLAAGIRDPWDREAAPDAASQAPLAFVQLPRNTAADGTGGSLGAHLLDGVRQLMTLLDPEGKLIISISQGTHAGPHDGSSMIESALDELLELRRENFAIVVGAGNAQRSDCHAATQIAPGETVELALRIPPRDSTDTFAECWYPRLGEKGAEHVLELQVQTPAGLTSPWLPAGRASELLGIASARAPAVAALIHEAAVPGGTDAMALLALSPSSGDDFAAPKPKFHAPSGVWRLRVSNKGSEHCVVHAWAERDQPVRPPWNDFPRWLDGPSSGSARQVGPISAGTLNTLATAQHVLVAGAMVQASQKRAGYSSLGPPRGGPRIAGGLPTPNILAASDTSTQLQGVRAAAVRGGDTVRMSGTSVAAPTLARQLYNRLDAAALPIGREDWQPVVAHLADPADRECRFIHVSSIQEPSP